MGARLWTGAPASGPTPEDADPGRALAVAATRLGQAVGVVLVVVLVGASILLAPAGTQVAPFWPAAGVAAVLVLAATPRQVPWLAVGVVLAVVGAALLCDRPWPLAVLLGLSTGLGSLTFRLVVRGGSRTPALRTLGDLSRLVVAAGAAALVAGSLAAVVLWAGRGEDPLPVLGFVAAAHGAALLVLVPVVLAPPLPHEPSPGRRLEALVQVVLAAAAFVVVFAPGQDLALAWAPLTFIVWAGVRLPPRWVSAEVLVIAVLVTALTAIGGGAYGPDDGWTTAVEQVYLVVLALLALALTVEAHERDTAVSRTQEDGRLLSLGFAESTVGLALLRFHDGGYTFLRINQSAARLLDHPAERLVGRRLDIAADDAGTDLAVRIAEDLAAGRAGSTRQHLQIPRGSRAWVQLSLSWIPDGPGHGLVNVQVVDLTELREAQELVRTVLLATTASAIVVTDAAGVVEVVNSGVAQMLGYRSEDVIGTDVVRLLSAAEVQERAAAWDTEPGPDVLVHDEDGTGQPPLRDWTVVRGDGTTLVASVSISAMHAPDGAVTGWVGLAQDVTERRAAEAALEAALGAERSAVEALHEVNRIKSELVAAVSHELRTPITSVLGFSELLRDEVLGGLNPAQSQVVSRVQANGERLLRLIEDLLTVSVVEAGTLAVTRCRTDVRLVAATAVQAVRETRPGRGVVVDLALQLDDREAAAWVDRGQLERVLINLLGNAAKFSRPGGRVLLSGSRHGDDVVLEVRDDGLGIDLADQERVFERFYRGGSATRAEVPGTGLGLSIVRSIVEAHGGTVSLVSTPGRGTTVTVVLPVHVPVDDHAALARRAAVT